jgi:hypothetical protein
MLFFALKSGYEIIGFEPKTENKESRIFLKKVLR